MRRGQPQGEQDQALIFGRTDTPTPSAVSSPERCPITNKDCFHTLGADGSDGERDESVEMISCAEPLRGGDRAG